MKKFKIAIFSGTIPSTTFIEDLIFGMAQEYEVMLFGVKTKTVSYPKKVRVYSTPKNRWTNLGLTLYRSVLVLVKSHQDLFKLLKTVQIYPSKYEKWIWYSKFLPIILHRPDIFHLQWARDIEFYMFLQNDFSIPIVVSLRGAHINYTPITKPRIAEMYRNLFPMIKSFHAVSEAISKEAQVYGARKESIRVIHSPIDDAVCSLYNQNKDVKDKKKLKIVSVGRFHWIKGYSYALKAIKILVNEGIDVKYTIIASGKIPESILFLMDRLKLSEVVKITSELPQEKLQKKLSNYDVMLLPSLKEGIANVVLEAMAIGLPVVSTNSGGMKEVITPETGWLVPIRDPLAMAKALIEVKNCDEKQMEAIRFKAHNLVKEQFNAENSFIKFKQLYKSLITKETGSKL